MTTLPSLDYVATLSNVAFTTTLLDVSRFSYVRTMFSASTDAAFGYNWYMTADGSVDNYEEVQWSSALPNALHHTVPIRAKYLSISYYPAVTPSDIRCTHLFYEGSISLSTLSNAGAGTQLYKTGTHQIKSLTSSDASVTLVDDGTSVDLSAIGATSVEVANSDLQVSYTSGVYTLDVGSHHGNGSISLTKGTASSAGVDSVVLGRNTTCEGANAVSIGTGADVQVANGVAIGHNAHCRGANTIAIGDSAGFNNNTVQNVYIGVRSGHGGSGSGNSRNVAIGFETMAFNLGSTNGCVYIGWNAGRIISANHSTVVGYSAGSNMSGSVRSCLFGFETAVTPGSTDCTFIGYRAGHTGTAASREVAIGSNVQPSNVAGRLSFGNDMEAPHGSFSMPNSGVPQAYIKINWNGTLYYIPAFTSVPV